MRAHVEAHLAPSHQLVEERLGVLAHPPPALACAFRLGGETVERPALVRGDFVEDLVGRDVAEMKPRRQAACRAVIGVVAVLRVAAEGAIEEVEHPLLAGLEPAFDVDRQDAVIDGQRPERVPREHHVGSFRPVVQS